jgi:predicted ATPase
VEAAKAQEDTFSHGVFFVSLAPLQSVDAIVPTVAQALGFSFYKGAEPRQQLLDYLRQKSVLLVMDNFEHLLACPEPGRGNGVDIVADILKAASEVRILTTSRERLNVQGEHLFPVTGMHFPDKLPETASDLEASSAVQLFLSSARRSRPSFELTDDSVRDVVCTCQLVHGMPLGILLAASLMEKLTPAEIAVEIERSLDVLATDLRDVPERQRSMRAIFEHSWKLLTERERDVLQRVSVFRGGFTRHAAREVTGATLRDLIALTHKSLLRRTAAPSTMLRTGGRSLTHKSLLRRTAAPSTMLRTGGRYDLQHELLRQYALEKLTASGEADTVRDTHSAYYAVALQQWGQDLKGSRQLAALAEMDVDIGNARVAWDWAVEQEQVKRLDRAMEGLGLFYAWRRRYQEGEAVCQAAVEKLSAMAFGDELRALAKILVDFWKRNTPASYYSKA